MKIAWFSPNFADGGVERTILKLSAVFAEHGHETQLVTLNINSRLLETSPSSLKVVDLGASRAALSIKKLSNYIRSEQPDAVISSQHYANIVAVAARKLSRTKTRLILTERTSINKALQTKSRPLRWIHTQLVKRSYKHGDVIIANSIDGAAELADFLGWPNERVGHIYNPADPSLIQARSTEPISHPWIEDSDNIPLFVAAGRLSPQKDYPTMLRALALANASKMYRLLIIGDGPDRTKLEQLATDLSVSDKVAFLGATENPYPYIANADLVLLSSGYEGMPNVLIEAQILGVPIVSTDCPTGPSELLFGGKAGYLVPVGDPNSMSTAIVEAINNIEEANAKAKLGHEHIDRFQPETAYQNYMNLISN